MKRYFVQANIIHTYHATFFADVPDDVSEDKLKDYLEYSSSKEWAMVDEEPLEDIVILSYELDDDNTEEH